MDVNETRKYIQMENILNEINKNYISLPISEVKRNNKILEQVIKPLTAMIKQKSLMFKNMYERQFCGGSFYDGTKVGKPEEYDLDYVINLPLLIEPQVEISDKLGFVYVRIKEYIKLIKNKDQISRYDKLDTLMVDDYLSTTKVLQWMEKIINLALNEFQKTPYGYCFDVDMSERDMVHFYVTVSKSYPAFTLKITNSDQSIYFYVDLVPCFQFSRDQWPAAPYKKNPTVKNNFLVVPKKPYHMEADQNVQKYWRLSFQEQERVLMTGSQLGAMKPSIKLLKKLRDKHNHKIASYYIKTVFLWEVDNAESRLWRQPLSYVFMKMLQRYTEMIKNKCIPYYWNSNFNLISHIKAVTLTDIGNKLKSIVEQVEQKLDEPFTLARYLVAPNVIHELKAQVDLGKKFHRKQVSVTTPKILCVTSDCLDAPSTREDKTDDDAEMQTKLLDVIKKLDIKTDNIYNVVTKLVEMNENLLKKCSDFTKRVENLEDEIDELKQQCQSSKN